MVDTSVAPYFDDYDEFKKFHRILFTPGRAVQTRELNQLQSIFQKQVERFGDHIFENGSMVIPGESNYNTAYEYLTIDGVDYTEIEDILQTNNVIVTGLSTGIVARVVQHEANTVDDPITLFLQYEELGAEDADEEFDNRFENGETVQLETELGVLFATANVVGTGQGSVFTIEPGIFYINGNFVQNDNDRIIMAKYSTTPDVVVGFRLRESTVSWQSDNTLLDNAAGTTNFNAIGADRLRMVLELEVHDIDGSFNPDNFIELAKFRKGELQKQVRGPDYNVLNDVMARRTYDQSGDYTVTSFGIRIREHLDNGSNDGLYPPEEDGDESKFVVGIEPGKAYVKGYEVENLSTLYVPVDKARDTANINNSTFSMPIGNFIVISNLSRLPSTGQYEQVTFYSGTPGSPGSIPSGNVLGTARMRYVELDPAESGRAALYLFDVRAANGSSDTSFVNNAGSVYRAGNPGFTALVQSEILESINYEMVFRLPVSNAKSLLESGLSDTSFSVYRQYTVTTDSNGVAILNAGPNETFAVPTATNSSAWFNSTIRDISNISTIGGIPAGSILTIDFGSSSASTQTIINVEVIKQIAQHRQKTPNQSSITRTPGDLSNRRFSLAKADAYRIISITENGVDKTDSYKLIKNITPEYYGVSQVELLPGEGEPTGNVEILFEYFSHGSGSFFSVDSYSTIPYGDIPEETISGEIVSMADVVDFRPRMNDAGTGFVPPTESPAPFSLLRCDVEHYLPRIDKVYVNRKGTFGVIKGVPSLEPKEPETPENTMAIYRLMVPPYTRDIKDISALYINNRRYTMRDIGKLEDRISTLEYFTTLSMIEQETEALNVVDPVTGLNRFKNGFIADGFADHALSLFSSVDYKCSISSDERELRPEFNMDGIDFDFDLSESSHVVKTGPLITLPYTEQVFISQTLASGTLNVNPYAVYRWNGTIDLTPNSDTWFDVVYTQPEVTHRVLNNGVLTQQWNSWGTSWTGGSTTTETGIMFNRGTQFTATTRVNGVTQFTAANTRHDRVGAWQTETVNTSVVQTGDRVVKQDVIPYMRSRDVQFSGTGLMPKSRVYAFFDGINVSAYCQQNGKAFGAALITDADGEINGIFRIPNNSTLRFRTGTKRFTLIDNAEAIRETSLSYADTDYSAHGTLQTRTQSIVATKSITTSIRPWDPLAQSFFVEQAGGVFLTSVDLYFATKDKSAPVTLQIREMVNGYPGQNVVPYSDVVLKPSQVNTSSDAGAATTFKFQCPIYLPEGNEYCFVVMSNSNEYTVYIATMGEKQVANNAYISKQPFIGVLFKSQNNTTWTADQESDMKFVVKSANFDISSNGMATFISKNPENIVLSNNPLVSTSGTGRIVVRCPNHGFRVGSKATISGVETAPGIPLGSLNTTHDVVDIIDHDNYVVEVGDSANSTGSFGGNSVNSDRNIILDVMQPIAEELLFESTNVDWVYQGTTYKSLDGIEVPYLTTPVSPVTPNENNVFMIPNAILSRENEIAHLQGNKSARFGANINSQLSNISPVIDVNRVSLVCVNNRINNPETLEENEPNGGNATARHLTAIGGLQDPASNIKLYIDVNQPQGSRVVVFYRTGNSAEEVMDKKWTVLPNISSTVASDFVTFTEFEYEINDISPFSFYQFKTVLLSDSSSTVPRVKRLRGLMLGT